MPKSLLILLIFLSTGRLISYVHGQSELGESHIYINYMSYTFNSSI